MKTLALRVLYAWIVVGWLVFVPLSLLRIGPALRHAVISYMGDNS